jgi:hypothetical protein
MRAVAFCANSSRLRHLVAQLDEGLYIPEALEGRYGSKAWMDRVHRRYSRSCLKLHERVVANGRVSTRRTRR